MDRLLMFIELPISLKFLKSVRYEDNQPWQKPTIIYMKMGI